MFDIGASELLLIVVVAIIVIGPKDMPLALRQAGRWIAKVRRVSAHFRSGLDAMVREAEMEEMEKKWRDKNAAIMKAHPDTGAETGEAPPPPEAGETAMEPLPPEAASAGSRGTDSADKSPDKA